MSVSMSREQATDETRKNHVYHMPWFNNFSWQIIRTSFKLELNLSNEAGKNFKESLNCN